MKNRDLGLGLSQKILREVKLKVVLANIFLGIGKTNSLAAVETVSATPEWTK